MVHHFAASDRLFHFVARALGALAEALRFGIIKNGLRRIVPADGAPYLACDVP
jgi:hypothetical protein